MFFTAGAKAHIFGGFTAGINACSTLIVESVSKGFTFGSVDRERAITLKLQGLPRMSVPACVSKARANQFSNPKVYFKSLAERDLQGHGRELCTR
jgi:hypothetical protein